MVMSILKVSVSLLQSLQQQISPECVVTITPVNVGAKLEASLRGATYTMMLQKSEIISSANLRASLGSFVRDACGFFGTHH